MNHVNRRQMTLRAPGRIVVLVERRSVGIGLVLAAIILALGTVALLIGDYGLGVGEALKALVGAGDDPLARFFVQEQRAPRVVAALLVGAGLAISGAIMQSLSANPLGSPDIIGFTIGASTGALLQIIVFDAGTQAVALGAVVGGFGAAFLIYLLAYRQGMSGQRLVLVGIGIAFVLTAVNTLLIVRASLGSAQTAAQWLAGSFNAMNWSRTAVVALALAVLVPAALALGRSLAMMSMGDDLAAGLGIRVERQRTWLIFVAVALVAIATATAGPIAFIALAAPQLARRLTRSARAGLVPAALMGGLLVLASDILAQRLFAPTQLAVGVVSGSLGGLYLIWLLSRESRNR